MIWLFIYIFGALLTATLINGKSTRKDYVATIVEIICSLGWFIFWPYFFYYAWFVHGKN